MRQNDFGLATEERERKRISSYQLGLELLRAKQRTAKFHKLIKLGSCGPYRKMSDVYVENCGHANTCIICRSHCYAHQRT